LSCKVKRALSVLLLPNLIRIPFLAQVSPPTSPPSFQLLEPEIRRERNDVLQCVRYIVEREFFDECQAS